MHKYFLGHIWLPCDYPLHIDNMMKQMIDDKSSANEKIKFSMKALSTEFMKV